MNTTDERLAKLGELQAMGLLTDTEYQAKRAEILREATQLTPQPTPAAQPNPVAAPAPPAPQWNPVPPQPPAAPQPQWPAPAPPQAPPNGYAPQPHNGYAPQPYNGYAPQPQFNGYAPQPHGHAPVAAPTGVNEYHQRKFAEFDAKGGGRSSSWNWAAFFFGAFWLFAKGLWAKGLIYLVVAVITSGVLTLPMAIYVGLQGNADYYRLKKHGKQF